MTTLRDHFEICLGKDIQDLIPLIGEALVLLDKPGTRALRRKIDKEFHHVVWNYGTLRRSGLDEGEWDALRAALPRYDRVTDRDPGGAARKAYAQERGPRARAIKAAAAKGLRLVVDNTTSDRRRSAPANLPHGGAV